MTQEIAREWFSYDPNTGVLTWRKSPEGGQGARRVKVGQEAGCAAKGPRGKFYRRVRLKGHGLVNAHAIIWVFVTGHWPVKPEEIDHADGDGLNNRWINLQLVRSRVEQMRNSRLRKDNTSGAVGVCFRKRSKRYEAYIMVEGRHLHLGRFSCLEDAVAAREAASEKHGFHANHGQDRPL